MPLKKTAESGKQHLAAGRGARREVGPLERVPSVDGAALPDFSGAAAGVGEKYKTGACEDVIGGCMRGKGGKGGEANKRSRVPAIDLTGV
eukprot:6204777-Pleurochrysis_carterae.AAC.15